MKTYTVVIPSHTDAPDYERTVTARNKIEAVNMIALVRDIDYDYVLEHCIVEQKVKEE